MTASPDLLKKKEKNRSGATAPPIPLAMRWYEWPTGLWKLGPAPITRQGCRHLFTSGTDEGALGAQALALKRRQIRNVWDVCVLDAKHGSLVQKF